MGLDRRSLPRARFPSPLFTLSFRFGYPCTSEPCLSLRPPVGHPSLLDCGDVAHHLCILCVTQLAERELARTIEKAAEERERLRRELEEEKERLQREKEAEVAEFQKHVDQRLEKLEEAQQRAETAQQRTLQLLEALAEQQKPPAPEAPPPEPPPLHAARYSCWR